MMSLGWFVRFRSLAPEPVQERSVMLSASAIVDA